MAKFYRIGEPRQEGEEEEEQKKKRNNKTTGTIAQQHNSETYKMNCIIHVIVAQALLYHTEHWNHQKQRSSTS